MIEDTPLKATKNDRLGFLDTFFNGKSAVRERLLMISNDSRAGETLRWRAMAMLGKFDKWRRKIDDMSFLVHWTQKQKI